MKTKVMLVFKLSVLLATYLNSVEAVINEGVEFRVVNNVEIITTGSSTILNAGIFVCSLQCDSQGSRIFQWNDGICTIYESDEASLKYSVSLPVIHIYVKTNLNLKVKPGNYIFLKSDGRIYISIPPVPWKNAQAECAKLEGNFKVIIPKTKFLIKVMDDFISEIGGFFSVDLIKNNSQHVFGDGTVFAQSEVADLGIIENNSMMLQSLPFVYYGGTEFNRMSVFDDTYFHSVFPAVCQSSK